MISNYSRFKYQDIINLNISLNFVFINSERRIVLNTKIYLPMQILYLQTFVDI